MVGTPIIGSKGTDIGEIIETHQIGTTFEQCNPVALATSIESILRDEQAIEKEALTAYAETVHWRSIGERHKRLYRELLYHS
jgi:glycosyltransferase involved in cell wall biosynthesis